MDIYSLTINRGNDVFYSKAFMDVIESHLIYFRANTKSTVANVDPKKADIYDGDLFGYLNEQGIAQEFHWIIMRINNLYSNSEFGPQVKILLIPDENEIEQIRSMFIATGNISL